MRKKELGFSGDSVYVLKNNSYNFEQTFNKRSNAIQFVKNRYENKPAIEKKISQEVGGSKVVATKDNPELSSISRGIGSTSTSNT